MPGELGKLIMPTIYSDVVQTRDDGMASGQIPILTFGQRVNTS